MHSLVPYVKDAGDILTLIGLPLSCQRHFKRMAVPDELRIIDVDVKNINILYYISNIKDNQSSCTNTIY